MVNKEIDREIRNQEQSHTKINGQMVGSNYMNGNYCDPDAVWQRENSFTAVMVIYFTMMLLFSIIRVVFSFDWFDSVNTDLLNWSTSIVIQVFIMFLFPLIAFKIYSKQSLKQVWLSFGFGKTTRRVLLYAVLLGVMIYVLNIFIAGIFFSFLSLIGFKFITGGVATGVSTGVGALLVSMFLIGVLPGFCEEASHRGMLMKSMMARIGVMRAVLFSSLMFGFMHMNIMQVFYATILGYLIALAVIATRSLWTGVIMHFMNNGLDVSLRWARGNEMWFGDILNPIFNIVNLPFGFFLFIIFMYFIYRMVMRIILMFAKESYSKDEKIRIAKFIQSNPDVISGRIDRGEDVSFEGLTQEVRRYAERLNSRDALKFYIGDDAPRKPLKPFEATLLSGVLVLGFTITLFTLIWGLL